MRFYCFLLTICLLCHIPAWSQKQTKLRVVVLAELHEQHRPYVDAAKIWLHQLATDSSLTIDYIENPDSITDDFLSRYQLFIQLNFPPYGWSDQAKAAFEKYITTGSGGWVGVHHATLLGDFNGYTMWPWFSQFMGDIRFTGYIADFAAADVKVEETRHPCMKNVPKTFHITKDEWYTYSVSPRKNVRVLASVNENSYNPNSTIKMGDHPVVWTNEHVKARNIYIFMGHDPALFTNQAYTTLLRNAIFWAASKVQK
ncbi:ThuA domain-containing protein [Xanthocytophaga flava]|uniref:ThuA domain-containing protein n=1 Tax=Xanthocytophaga flava TaxID=3048013 RepID=UPI0028D01FD9|nr:ThuA domain-containing protein [Xanthocytophaga flavus]MDJ1472029.1 ThuA domain-containing protein [Xanthocytophaga flavus]